LREMHYREQRKKEWMKEGKKEEEEGNKVRKKIKKERKEGREKEEITGRSSRRPRVAAP